MSVAAGDAGAAVGGVIFTWLGRAGGAVFGPGGAIVGGIVGKHVGQVVGRAAAVAIAGMMESANEDAEDLSDEDAATTCADCAEVDCFNVPEGVDPEEFLKQLKEQQDAINGMGPDKLLENMRQYQSNGRPTGDASARAAERQKYFDDHIGQRTNRHIAKGETPANARNIAENELLNEMKRMDATHVVDLIAGGDGALSGLGDRSVNRSIGSQWRHRGGNSDRTRAQQLREAAKRRRDRGQETMEDISLEVCPDGADTEGSGPDRDAGGSGGSPSNGGAGSGPVS